MSFHYAINLKDTDHPLSHLESTTCSLQSSTEGEAHRKAENMLGIYTLVSLLVPGLRMNAIIYS